MKKFILPIPLKFKKSFYHLQGIKKFERIKGFTFIEVLLVIGILTILAALTFPLALNFYKSQQLDACAQDVIQILRRAQLKAISAESDSSFGVYFDEIQKKYVLFKGAFFDPEDSDNEEFDLPPIVSLKSHFSEIIFSKFEGEPNVFGNIILSSDKDSRIININKLGRISLIPVSPSYLAQMHYRWRNDDGGE